MEFKTNVSIHNKFKVVVRNAITGEIEQEGYAENMVLDRMYTRLTTFNTYFTNIVFGSGTGTLSASRTTLFSRIGNKTATQTQLIRAYPTSVWTKSIRLGASEFNGQFIREVGISEDATQINTHAFVSDSEGNPLEIQKTDTRIIDIYATVYANVYDVDSGLYWYGNGLRDYLTGSTVPSDQIGVGGNIPTEGTGGFTIISGTRTNNTSEKWAKTTGTFSELQHNNKDVRVIIWNNMGLCCMLPRIGIFQNHQRTNVTLGVGNGVNKIFNILNKNIKDLVVKVDGSIVSGYVLNTSGNITFDTAPLSGEKITVDYKCDWIPKDEDHILKVTFKIQFGGGQPSPVMPEPTLPDLSKVPGNNVLLAGTSEYGYYGVTSAEDFINGDNLATAIGLTTGIAQNSDSGWLKYSVDGKPLFVAKKTIRHTISWNNIDSVGGVFGGATLWFNGILYKVRLLTTQEWNKLLYPVHIEHPSGAPNWDNFGDCDLLVKSSCGNGSYTWTSTPTGSDRVIRGDSSVTFSNYYSPSFSNYYGGFRPVLEVIF